MLGADVVVPQRPGLFLGQDYDLPGAFSEPLKHHLLLLMCNLAATWAGRNSCNVPVPILPDSVKAATRCPQDTYHRSDESRSVIVLKVTVCRRTTLPAADACTTIKSSLVRIT